MKFLLVQFVLLFFNGLYSQKLLLPTEECVFSYKTSSGKTMMLAKNKLNNNLIYRFGNEKSIELTFPENGNKSSDLFSYNYYVRGGGKENAGIDIDNLKFKNNEFTYVIYTVYSAGDVHADESFDVGIIIFGPEKKEFRIKGITESIVGNLQGFRTNNLVHMDLESGLDF